MGEIPSSPWKQAVPSLPPSISILVATWNCAAQLGLFLGSLADQCYGDWELLLLDNCSSDGSAELVAAHCRLHPEQRILWHSLPDQGIYEAWNRGLGLAQGRYFCFIGADDSFLGPESLGSIAALSVSGADLITARNAYHDAQGRFLRHWGGPWQWRRNRQSMTIAHPGMLVHRELLERFGPFDASFRICADYEWFLRLPLDLRTVHSSDSILKVLQGGISHMRIGLVFAETFRAQRRHLGLFPSTGCWALNWAKYGRRRLIGLA